MVVRVTFRVKMTGANCVQTIEKNMLLWGNDLFLNQIPRTNKFARSHFFCPFAPSAALGNRIFNQVQDVIWTSYREFQGSSAVPCSPYLYFCGVFRSKK